MAAEVYLNGAYIGTVDNPKEFVEQVKIDRRKGKL